MTQTNTTISDSIVPRILPGEVVAVLQNGTIVTDPTTIEATGADPTTITYNVDYLGPNGASIFIENTAPSNQRPSVTHFIIPAKLGSPATIYVMRGKTVFTVDEGLFVGPCP